jgi:hypothetical protein
VLTLSTPLDKSCTSRTIDDEAEKSSPRLLLLPLLLLLLLKMNWVLMFSPLFLPPLAAATAEEEITEAAASPVMRKCPALMDCHPDRSRLDSGCVCWCCVRARGGVCVCVGDVVSQRTGERRRPYCKLHAMRVAVRVAAGWQHTAGAFSHARTVVAISDRRTDGGCHWSYTLSLASLFLRRSLTNSFIRSLTRSLARTPTRSLSRSVTARFCSRNRRAVIKHSLALSLTRSSLTLSSLALSRTTTRPRHTHQWCRRCRRAGHLSLSEGPAYNSLGDFRKHRPEAPPHVAAVVDQLPHVAEGATDGIDDDDDDDDDGGDDDDDDDDDDNDDVNDDEEEKGEVASTTGEGEKCQYRTKCQQSKHNQVWKPRTRQKTVTLSAACAAR